MWWVGSGDELETGFSASSWLDVGGVEGDGLGVMSDDVPSSHTPPRLIVLLAIFAGINRIVVHFSPKTQQDCCILHKNTKFFV